MGVLEEALVKRILEMDPIYKRDVMEQTIRDLLGAKELEEITDLPPRRGAADGGFDGVMDVDYFNNQQWESTRSGLNVKVRSSNFTREQLGCFLLDMDRESINIGLIITATDLSPDARSEFNRKNSQGDVRLFHLRISDILSGAFTIPNLRVEGRTINDVLSDNINTLIQS